MLTEKIKACGLRLNIRGLNSARGKFPWKLCSSFSQVFKLCMWIEFRLFLGVLVVIWSRILLSFGVNIELK